VEALWFVVPSVSSERARLRLPFPVDEAVADFGGMIVRVCCLSETHGTSKIEGRKEERVWSA
jgi:hypothetical protein